MTADEYIKAEYEYFKDIQTKIMQLDNKQQEQLEEFLGNMEESTPVGGRTVEKYEKYIKKFKSQNKILFIAFKTRNKRTLAHICKYILELEWNNEWVMAVAGQHTKTIFGWFD